MRALFSAPSKLKFISLSDIKSRLSNYSPSLSTLSKYLKKAGGRISRRKFTNFTKVRGEPDPQRIEDFKRTFLDRSKDSIICIDETGFSNIGNAFYGYYAKGKIPLSCLTRIHTISFWKMVWKVRGHNFDGARGKMTTFKTTNNSSDELGDPRCWMSDTSLHF